MSAKSARAETFDAIGKMEEDAIAVCLNALILEKERLEIVLQEEEENA
jgi:hypothetical protein